MNGPHTIRDNETISATAPWTIKGVSSELRHWIKSLAVRDGVTVARWLEKAAREAARLGEASPAAPEARTQPAEAATASEDGDRVRSQPITSPLPSYPPVELLQFLRGLVADEAMPDGVREEGAATLKCLLVRARLG